MANVNPNNGNKTHSDILLWDTFKSDTIFHWSLTFIIGIFQFHCRSEHKQVH